MSVATMPVTTNSIHLAGHVSIFIIGKLAIMTNMDSFQRRKGMIKRPKRDGTLTREVEAALSKGESKFTSVIPCQKCGSSIRYSKRSGNCVECYKAANRRRYLKAQQDKRGGKPKLAAREQARLDGLEAYIGKKCEKCGDSVRDTDNGFCMNDCGSIRGRKPTPIEAKKDRLFDMAMSAFRVVA